MTLAPAYTAAQVRAAEAPLLAAGEPLMDRAAAALAAVCWWCIRTKTVYSIRHGRRFTMRS